jgi:hypothetical protein
MNQQEIKANLPPLPFVNAKGYALVECAQGVEIANTRTFNKTTLSDESVSAAITHAINNTYGKGINPESVPDMYNALQTIDEILHAETMGEVSKIIKDILKNATL